MSSHILKYSNIITGEKGNNVPAKSWRLKVLLNLGTIIGTI